MLTLLRPRYWPGHLAMLVCVSIAVGLGVWQYDAWQTRRADAAKDVTNDAPVALSSVMTGDSPFPGGALGKPVSFTGSWMPEGTVFVADRYVDGRRGYWVVTPVQVTGGDSAVPVVRGWSEEPEAGKPEGKVAIVGWLQATEGSGPLDKNPQDDVIPTMRIASIVEHVDTDLYSGYVVAKDQTPAVASSGLEPVTPDAVPPVSGFTALRNLLYAIEWWIFGGFALFVWVRWCRDTLHPPQETEVEPELEDAT